eukprot:sb/3475266/
MYFGGLLEKKIGARLTILIGCIVNTLVRERSGRSCESAVFFSYWSIESFYGLILTYGLIFGFGIGLAYSTTMTLAIKWLPAIKGIVAGCVVAGFGMGATVFNPIITMYINPDNVHANCTPYAPVNNET